MGELDIYGQQLSTLRLARSSDHGNTHKMIEEKSVLVLFNNELIYLGYFNGSFPLSTRNKYYHYNA